MTFSYAIIRRTIFGDKRIVYGTFSNDGGDSGGNIFTGLHKIEHVAIQHTGNAAVADSPSVKPSMPADDPIEIVTTANKSGVWIATGL